MDYDEVRNELGLLAPLDALVALRCVSRGPGRRPGGGGWRVTRYVLGEVDTLRFWETSIRPHLRRRRRRTLAAGPRSRVARSALRPAASSRPARRPPWAPAIRGANGAQPVYQSMQVETWVGLEDGLIRAERMTARVLPPISDPKKMPDPIDLDVRADLLGRQQADHDHPAAGPKPRDGSPGRRRRSPAQRRQRPGQPPSSLPRRTAQPPRQAPTPGLAVQTPARSALPRAWRRAASRAASHRPDPESARAGTGSRACPGGPGDGWSATDW